MPRYRIAFFITLATTLLLAAALGVVWFKPAWLNQTWIPSRPSAPSAATPAPEPAPPAASSEPSLAPVTLTPERVQSIGVKTGLVQYKDVHDEIRTTGDVEVDETRLSEVQVRFSGWI